jgi:hypothetical protein
MTDEEINKAIAEACGFRVSGRDLAIPKVLLLSA